MTWWKTRELRELTEIQLNNEENGGGSADRIVLVVSRFVQEEFLLDLE